MLNNWTAINGGTQKRTARLSASSTSWIVKENNEFFFKLLSFGWFVLHQITSIYKLPNRMLNIFLISDVIIMWFTQTHIANLPLGGSALPALCSLCHTKLFSLISGQLVIISHGILWEAFLCIRTVHLCSYQFRSITISTSNSTVITLVMPFHLLCIAR